MNIFKLIFLFSLITLISCKKEVKTDIPDSRLTIINASEINKKIRKGNDITYKNATITGTVDFTQSDDASLVTAGLIEHRIHSTLTFYDCTFKGKLTAKNNAENFEIITKFYKSICFINCTFQDTVDFSSSDFKDIVNFSNSIFQNFVSFKSAFFSPKGLIFTKSHFIKYAKFNLMHVEGNCNFSNAVFDDNILFQLSRFNNTVEFNAAKFNQNANFTKVKFKDDVFFNYAEFYKKVQFNTSFFQGRAEFIKTKFNMISEFKNCQFLSETKFKNAEISGILTFENSIFYISNPNNFDMKILKESNLILNNIVILSKNH